MIYQLEILSKNSFKNQHANHVFHEIKEMGVKEIKHVSYSPIFKLDGDLNIREISKIARDLLMDPVTQTYTLCNPHRINRDREKTKASIYEVEVWYKAGVTDTTAESVKKALKDIGIQKNVKVKTGHKFVFEARLSQHNLEKIVKKLLVNKIIQDYKVR